MRLQDLHRKSRISVIEPEQQLPRLDLRPFADADLLDDPAIEMLDRLAFIFDADAPLGNDAAGDRHQRRPCEDRGNPHAQADREPFRHACDRIGQRFGEFLPLFGVTRNGYVGHVRTTWLGF
ncbi:hypothetical protein [Sphingomonas sp. So64.6b]|uniref:hypothetical protein n=1 Tax=Sphingomonas sp. So64.6b TaxID=2997354 RepID=UPI0016047914|nr:hypothetical protein [Sphingomonas sp. So64.6b]